MIKSHMRLTKIKLIHKLIFLKGIVTNLSEQVECLKQEVEYHKSRALSDAERAEYRKTNLEKEKLASLQNWFTNQLESKRLRFHVHAPRKVLDGRGWVSIGTRPFSKRKQEQPRG